MSIPPRDVRRSIVVVNEVMLTSLITSAIIDLFHIGLPIGCSPWLMYGILFVESDSASTTNEEDGATIVSRRKKKKNNNMVDIIGMIFTAVM